MMRHAALDAQAAPNKPLGHHPHAPAWASPMPAHVVLEQMAVQYPDGDVRATLLRKPLEHVVTLPHGPRQVDRATHVDGDGRRNDILLCYWDDADEHSRWAEDPEVAGLWDGQPDQVPDTARWHEVLGLEDERLETLDSEGREGRGFSALGELQPTEVHEYWGGMRDRIAASHTDPLNGDAVGTARGTGNQLAQGRRVTVTAPENLCFIRTGQDWQATRDQERATYEQTVEPVLERGADFLRDNPDETGCLSARYVHEVDELWRPLDRSCVLAYFRSLGHLERWTWSHPTHIAIFDAFMSMVRQQGNDVQLVLWHEVAVLTSSKLQLEYVGCHPRTGLLATLGHPVPEEDPS